MPGQLSTVAKLPSRDRILRLSHEDMAAVERAMRLQLGRWRHQNYARGRD
jgi:hypothetical protein